MKNLDNTNPSQIDIQEIIRINENRKEITKFIQAKLISNSTTKTISEELRLNNNKKIFIKPKNLKSHIYINLNTSTTTTKIDEQPKEMEPWL